MTSVDILICTYKRPQVVDTLQSLTPCVDAVQNLRVIVADNDATDSARLSLAEAAKEAPFDIVYVHAPKSNISIARNACLQRADAEWVAFIDDDELASETWLPELLSVARRTGADGVFGPAKAVYTPETPEWMVEQDHHSNAPVLRNGQVMTGHTCNGLLRWSGAPWMRERFDLSRGQSGGEDTEFFFRLFRQGARFEIAPDAVVYEHVAPARLDPAWLVTRKYRMGQSYASYAANRRARAALLATAGAKAAYCGLRRMASRTVGEKMFWKLRHELHKGVCAGCLSMPQSQIYGK